MIIDNEMQEWDVEIKDTVSECDSLREKYEGVGLSDALVHIVHLAFARGAIHQCKQSFRTRSHGSDNNPDALGL